MGNFKTHCVFLLLFLSFVVGGGGGKVWVISGLMSLIQENTIDLY